MKRRIKNRGGSYRGFVHMCPTAAAVPICSLSPHTHSQIYNKGLHGVSLVFLYSYFWHLLSNPELKTVIIFLYHICQIILLCSKPAPHSCSRMQNWIFIAKSDFDETSFDLFVSLGGMRSQLSLLTQIYIIRT